MFEDLPETRAQSMCYQKICAQLAAVLSTSNIE